jgi:hypothetical protein
MLFADGAVRNAVSPDRSLGTRHVDPYQRPRTGAGAGSGSGIGAGAGSGMGAGAGSTATGGATGPPKRQRKPSRPPQLLREPYDSLLIENEDPP